MQIGEEWVGLDWVTCQSVSRQTQAQAGRLVTGRRDSHYTHPLAPIPPPAPCSRGRHLTRRPRRSPSSSSLNSFIAFLVVAVCVCGVELWLHRYGS